MILPQCPSLVHEERSIHDETSATNKGMHKQNVLPPSNELTYFAKDWIRVGKE